MNVTKFTKRGGGVFWKNRHVTKWASHSIKHAGNQRHFTKDILTELGVHNARRVKEADSYPDSLEPVTNFRNSCIKIGDHEISK